MVSKKAFESGRFPFLVRFTLENCFLTIYSLDKGFIMRFFKISKQCYASPTAPVFFCHGEGMPLILEFIHPMGDGRITTDCSYCQKAVGEKILICQMEICSGCWTKLSWKLHSHKYPVGRLSSTLKDPGLVANNTNITLRSCNKSWVLVGVDWNSSDQ